MLFIIFVLFLNVCFCSPEAPVWPNHFAVPFLYSVKGGSVNWNGYYYYDYTTLKGRADHFSPQHALFCNVYPTDSTCIELVKDGWRLLYWPDYNDKCCKCCNTSSGCGILDKNWLEGADFVGYEKWNGTVSMGWNAKTDNGNNFYFVDSTVYPKKQIPVFIRMNSTKGENDEIMTFNRNHYDTSPIDPSVFELPDHVKCNELCKGVKETAICEYFQ